LLSGKRLFVITEILDDEVLGVCQFITCVCFQRMIRCGEIFFVEQAKGIGTELNNF
jgi:hypothetical protein